MPYPKRFHLQGGLFHVIARSNRGEQIVLDSEDCLNLLTIIESLKHKFPFTLYAYALMPHHIHLLIKTQTLPLPALMQRILTAHTKNLNSRYKKRGHLFAGRYSAILCQPKLLPELIRYINLHPCRSQIGRHPDSWPWTSHYDYMDRRRWSLVNLRQGWALFGRDKKRAIATYERFLLTGLKMGHRPDFYPPRQTPILGDPAFVQKQQHLINGKKGIDAEGPSKNQSSLSALAQKHCPAIPLALLRSPSRSHPLSSARGRLILAALKDGHRPSALAAFLNLSPSAVSKILIRSL
jgi:REP element-mobilizing transposase RayT